MRHKNAGSPVTGCSYLPRHDCYPTRTSEAGLKRRRSAHCAAVMPLVGFLEWDLAKGKGIDDHLAAVGPEMVLDEIAHVDLAGSA
jgi:hypothetical protein